VATKYLHNEASMDERKQLDMMKEKMCKENGITLVKIPHWWDRKLESLASTIYSHRPDLFSEPPMGTPIPLAEPTVQKKYRTSIDSNRM
jgi:hypothetical protein